MKQIFAILALACCGLGAERAVASERGHDVSAGAGGSAETYGSRAGKYSGSRGGSR